MWLNLGISRQIHVVMLVHQRIHLWLLMKSARPHIPSLKQKIDLPKLKDPPQERAQVTSTSNCMVQDYKNSHWPQHKLTVDALNLWLIDLLPKKLEITIHPLKTPLRVGCNSTVTTHAWSWPRPTGWNPQAHWLDPSHATLISGSGNHQGTFHRDITRFCLPSIIFLFGKEVPMDSCIWFWLCGTAWSSHPAYKEAVLQDDITSSI